MEGSGQELRGKDHLAWGPGLGLGVEGPSAEEVQSSLF